MAYLLTYNQLTPVSKTIFTVSSCTVAVTEFMEVTWSYITGGQFVDCEVLKNFQGLCGPKRTRTGTCKLVLEDKNFPREIQHCHLGHNCLTVIMIYMQSLTSLQEGIFAPPAAPSSYRDRLRTSVAGPTVWNSLSLSNNLCDPAMDSFSLCLKTFLFFWRRLLEH